MTYEQDFDAENRLAVVTNTVTGEVTQFFYDGDGARVKKVDPTGATIYVGGYYEEFRPALRTWTFTGQVQAGGSGLAGATVRLYHWTGATWAEADAQTTGSGGSFGLDYSGYDQDAPAFRLVETDLACYQSVTATSPSLAVANSNELSGTVPSAGTYAGHIFTDAPAPGTPGITTVYPSGCQPVSGSLRFWWTLPACWTWTNYTYVLRNLDTGQDVSSGSTTATEVTLAVNSATNYRLTVTGHKTGYTDVSQSTEVFIAYPVPTNLQPSGQVPAGDTTFTWSSGVSEMEVHYRLYRVYAPPHWPPLELITEGTTTAGAVTLTLAPPTPPATQQEYRFTVQATAACNLGLAQTTVWTVDAPPPVCDPIENGGFDLSLHPWTGTGSWTGSVGHNRAGAAQLEAVGRYVEQTITPGQPNMTLHVWGLTKRSGTLRVVVQDAHGIDIYADQSFTLGASWSEYTLAVDDTAVGQECVVRLSNASGIVYADDVSITCEGGKPPEGATVGGWAQAVAGPGDWPSRPAGLAAPVATQSAQQQPVIVTKYYTFNGKRVALRQDGALTFLHGDHLGSTALATDASGGAVARQWYYPYGEQRAAEGALLTDYRFTGQKLDSYINLYQMGDRWYNAELGRWISPDPIIPEPGNPQALNRYSYVYNNPLKYIDPTGHWADSGDTDVEEQQNADPPPPPPMGTWEYIRWLLTLVPEGQEVLTYINSHGTKIYIIGSLQDAGNSLYPNNMIILNASRFSAQDLDTQIDVAGDIGHEVEHQIWGTRGALWPSREQEGAAFARGDAVKAALFRYFGDEATAATYKFPDMTTEQRIANLQDNPEYGSGWYTDHQIWGVDLVRDMGSTIQRWFYDWWFNTYCSGNVEGVYP